MVRKLSEEEALYPVSDCKLNIAEAEGPLS